MFGNRVHLTIPLHLPYVVFSHAKYRALSSLIVFLVLIVAGTLLLVYPNLQHASDLKEQISKTKQDIKARKNLLIQQTKLLELQQHLKRVLMPFVINEPDYLVTTNLITQIENWSKQHNLLLNKVVWGQLKQDDDKKTQAVSLYFTGTYQQLINLFEYIGQYYGLVAISEFNIHSDSNSYKGNNTVEQISLDLNLDIVMLNMDWD
jgi:Tfp pilus assembly protein PilO